ncbi:MAG: hypothetical protein ACKOS8_05820, partial [Gemmataceae bacterium]
YDAASQEKIREFNPFAPGTAWVPRRRGRGKRVKKGPARPNPCESLTLRRSTFPKRVIFFKKLTSSRQSGLWYALPLW